MIPPGGLPDNWTHRVQIVDASGVLMEVWCVGEATAQMEEAAAKVVTAAAGPYRGATVRVIKRSPAP